MLSDELARRSPLRRGASSSCGGACVAGGPLRLSFLVVHQPIPLPPSSASPFLVKQSLSSEPHHPAPRRFRLIRLSCRPVGLPVPPVGRPTPRPPAPPSAGPPAPRRHYPVRWPFFCGLLKRGGRRRGGGGAAKACVAGGKESRAHSEGGIVAGNQGGRRNRERCVGVAAARR